LHFQRHRQVIRAAAVIQVLLQKGDQITAGRQGPTFAPLG